MLTFLLLFAAALAAGYYGVQENSVCKYVSARATDIETGAGCSNTGDNIIDCCACVDNVIGFIDLDGCATLEIDWDTLDVTLSLELNDTVLFETTFGFDSAPSLCTDLWGIHICVDLENLDLHNWEFTGCLHVIIDNKVDINFGCWDIKKDDA